jgi:hypothetical protein
MSSLPKQSPARAALQTKKGSGKTIVGNIKTANSVSRRKAKTVGKGVTRAAKAVKPIAPVQPVQEDLSDLAPSRARMRRLQAGRAVKAEWFEDGYSEELSK